MGMDPQNAHSAAEGRRLKKGFFVRNILMGP